MGFIDTLDPDIRYRHPSSSLLIVRLQVRVLSGSSGQLITDVDWFFSMIQSDSKEKAQGLIEIIGY